MIKLYSLAKIWKMAVKKNWPPFTILNSWYRKAMSAQKQKMQERIMRACTAWIHSENC